MTETCIVQEQKHDGDSGRILALSELRNTALVLIVLYYVANRANSQCIGENPVRLRSSSEALWQNPLVLEFHVPNLLF